MTELEQVEQWLTAYVAAQPGPQWPRDPGIHTKAGDTAWSKGARWRYNGRAWTLDLVPDGVLFGKCWALGLLHCVPAEHMPFITRDMGDRWVVQFLVDGRDISVAHEDAGMAVGLAFRRAYDVGRDGK